MLGPAPIVDFDGTLARLDVAWEELRAELGVTRLGELWAAEGVDGWARVAAAEESAAADAAPVAAVVAALGPVVGFAVLTSNTERAVWRFLRRFPDLEAKTTCIVGRETLAGPKDDFEVFAGGFEICVRATSVARGRAPVRYVGDAPYEIEFARRLGAEPVMVDEIEVRS